MIEATLKELVDERLSSRVDHWRHGPGTARRYTGGNARSRRQSNARASVSRCARSVCKYVPTAILSRQVAVVRGQSLIINLPGQPKSIRETLEGVKDANGKALVQGDLRGGTLLH